MTTPNTHIPFRIALVGTPNCGKSALFNSLTGRHQKVANYSGVTVERVEGFFTLPNHQVVNLLDLPGLVSLRARSPDEVVARDVILGHRAEAMPQAAIIVANASQLLPALRLTLELKLTGLPLILAINMMDIAKAHGRSIDIERLAQLLDIPVVSSVAVRRHGTDALLDALQQQIPCWRAATPRSNVWQMPSLADIRASHRTANSIAEQVIKTPGTPLRVTSLIDRITMHPVLGLIILFAIMFCMFQAVFSWAAPAMDGIGATFDALSDLIKDKMPESHLRNLLTDGVIAGVGSVVVFLPQIIILFIWIVALEDSGYMARAAFLLDRMMKGAGLHGRSFIPLLSSFACAIPGIMATRTINHQRDRLTTIMIAPLMTCSARLPVYTLIIGALVPEKTIGGFIGLQGLVMFALYALGILGALAIAFCMKLLMFRTSGEPLLLDLPSYKTPHLRTVIRAVANRAYLFLRRSGTTIFAMMVVLWFMSTFPLPPADATMPTIHYSLIGKIGAFLEPLMRPLGFSWQMTVSLIPAMAAREVAVGALATLYAVGGEEGNLGAILSNYWSLPAALSFLAWFVFAPQCISTLAVVRRETGGWKWTLIMFAYMTALAWIASFATFRLSSWLLG